MTDTVEGTGVERMAKAIDIAVDAISSKQADHRENCDCVRKTDTGDAADGARRPTVTVVIPTRNEARNLPYVAKRMPPVDQIVVVDGSSVDNTIEVARQLWPDALIINQSGRGDKDIFTVAEAFDDAEWKEFIRSKARGYDDA